MRSLRKELDAFTEVAGPSAERLEAAADTAARQVARLENLIDVAGSVTETMDGATASAVRVLSNPVIKTAAVARGTRKAARRLTKSEES